MKLVLECTWGSPRILAYRSLFGLVGYVIPDFVVSVRVYIYIVISFTGFQYQAHRPIYHGLDACP
jgi:hypothetical protein